MEINLFGVEDIKGKVVADLLGFEHYFRVHNARHSVDVAETAGILAQYSSMDIYEQKALYFAGLMHDIGLKTTLQSKTYLGHEDFSARYALEVLPEYGYGSLIPEVVGPIYATRMPQNPRNILDEILCDADLANFGRDDFFRTCAELRIEIKEITGMEIPIKKWLLDTYSLISSHKYHTSVARGFYDKKKTTEYLKT